MSADFVGTGKPLTRAAFDNAVQRIGGDAAALWSLITVETRGFGFLPDKRPKILFERHIFHGRTNGRFDLSNPDISSSHPGGYSNESGEYDRLARAMALDHDAALESASWGLGQVMGFNAKGLRYLGAQGMVTTFLNGEDEQLEASVRFIETNPALATAVKSRTWKTVAFFYNGSGYAENQYDTKLESNYGKYSAGTQPDLALRTAQARLLYLGIDPKGVDGVTGNGTAGALRRFQTASSLPQNGQLDAQTAAALEAALPF